MLGAIHEAVDPIMGNVEAQTPYDSIRSAYGTQDMVLSNAVAVNLLNASPIWPFREDDTRPHWAPWGPGTALSNWSIAHGIPPFLVARKISRFGTTGNHIFRDNTHGLRPMLDQSVQGALREFTLQALRGAI
jgi:hypothetical protein